MDVKIIKPDATLYEGDARLVQLPGIDGLFEILNNHAPIISALKKGKIRIVNNGNETLYFDIRPSKIPCIQQPDFPCFLFFQFV